MPSGYNPTGLLNNWNTLMKLKKPLYSLLLLLIPLQPLSAGEIIRDYPAEKISATTYVIHGPLGYPSVENQGFMNNPAFIVTDAGVVVIDPGSSVQAGRMVLKQIRQVTDKPVTHVFDTHVHGDHWLGNQAITDSFPDAVLIGHPAMIKRARDGEAQRWVSLMANATDNFTLGTEAVLPNKAVNEADSLSINGITFRIYAPGEAHSGTDIMIEYVEDSVLFTGDNVLHTRIARMDDGTFLGNSNACQVAIDIGAKYYVPGHGPTGDIGVPMGYKQYLDTLYAAATRYYDEGLSDFEMKASIIKMLEPYHEWVNFHDEVGKHISLAVLEVERRAFD
jgi:glyoxylase-like metal-dependent hydrolase (beta-lactamase superfamily II)